MIFKPISFTPSYSPNARFWPACMRVIDGIGRCCAFETSAESFRRLRMCEDCGIERHASEEDGEMKDIIAESFAEKQQENTEAFA